VGNVEVDGLDSGKLGEWLWEKHRILVTPIKLLTPGKNAAPGESVTPAKGSTSGEGSTPGAEAVELEGLRISPSVYTLPSDLERFCDAMEEAMRKGIGK
jgi:selenocysteine lyase/cysteine desulfurase